jgi:hypothetical protein
MVWKIGAGWNAWVRPGVMQNRIVDIKADYHFSAPQARLW